MSGEQLRESVLSGVRWITLVRVVGEAMSFGATVVLARLITPAEFGHVALALVVVALAYALVDESFSGALIQWKSVRKEDWETSLLLAFAMALALVAAVFALADPVIEPLFGSRTAELFLVATPAFLLAALELVPRAVLTRRLEFRTMSILGVGADILRTLTAVFLAAVVGLDGEAVIIALLVGALAGVATQLTLVRLPRPRFHRRSARELVAFGAPTAGSSVLWNAEQNIDYLVLGAQRSAADLGFYWRAYALGVQYQTKITSVMAQMAFPVYSRTPGLDEMRKLRMRVLRVHSVIVVPLVALLIVAAPDLVPWLYGERWEPAVVPTQILAVGGIFAALATGTGPVVLAAGKPKPLFFWNVAKLTTITLVVLLTAPEGITAVAIGVTSYRALECFASYELLLHRLVGIPLRSLWTDASAGVLSSLPLLGAAFAASELGSALGAPTFVQLLLIVAAGGLAYLATLRLAFREAWADLSLIARRTFGRGRHA